MKKYIFFLFSTLLLISSCSKEKRKADLTGIDFNIKIQRFDSAFWMIDTTNIKESFHSLLMEYPDIAPIYTEKIIQFGHPDSSITHSTYKIFHKDTSVQRLYTDALEYYQDMSDLENDLTLAFRRAKYFFPKWATPNVYCHVSGFNNSMVVGEGFISLSIDNYMGSDYPIYQRTNIYRYQLPNMCREKIVSDYITAWISGEIYNKANGNLLNDIIHYGKILYTVSVLLPNTAENIIMGYTENQWKWVKTHEEMMWNTLISSKDLYSTHPLTKSRYINDGPFTRPFTQQSPGRAGTFIGWQIIESYMENNPDITLEQLLYSPDAQIILNQSNYNP